MNILHRLIYDSVEEEEFKQKPVSLQAPPPKPPRLSLNPFGSDFEDDDEGNEVVPEGKKQKQVAELEWLDAGTRIQLLQIVLNTLHQFY